MNKQPDSSIAYFYKESGETPLHALTRFRNEYPEYKDEVLSYAGRLDPLASGILPILIGKEANRKENKEKYLQVDKEYEIDVLFGIGTDTGDILGKIVDYQKKSVKENFDFEISEIKEILPKFLGTREQKYPLYSSRTVLGKPLFEYARENTYENIEVPTKKITIYSLGFVKTKKLTKKELQDLVISDIAKIHGDFRQEEILKLWEKTLGNKDTRESFIVFTFVVNCSSGTYMRTLAEDIGKELKIPSLALRILRTKVYPPKL